jgi:chorismate mutase/prephenate dehydratase
MNLDEIRQNIDSIDRQLVELICSRMNMSKAVAEYKVSNGMKVFDAAREKTILDKVGQFGGEYGNAVRLIYGTIMEQSRALQYPLVNAGDVAAPSAVPDPDSVTRIACQGVKGSYSSLAGRKMFKNADILCCAKFADVFDAVERGDAELGVLPVENSWAGSVHEVYDLLMDRKFYITAAADAAISHNLIGTPDADIGCIKRVMSHEQALRQCAAFINEIGAEPVVCSNTAVGVSQVAKLGDRHIAAIGSADAAHRYGMKILKSDIASADKNVTRFVAVSKQFCASENADKISMVFSLPHKPGTLYSVFSRFAAAGLNMSKIESRPIKNRNFEYLFYVDLIGRLINGDTVNIIRSLEEELDEFTLLGNYEEISFDIE